MPPLNSTNNTESENVYNCPPIKHVPFPRSTSYYLQSEITDEFLQFAFSFLAASFQFLHLYRTVWWLPDTHMHQTVNFHLIDKSVALFLLILLSRRFWYSICITCVDLMVTKKRLYRMRLVLRYVFFFVITILLGICCVDIYFKHNNRVVYMCYPIIVYVIIFHFNIEPFLRTVYEGDMIYINGSPLHCCSTNPSAIRTEIDSLKKDFNNRFKQVIFTTLFNAYYGSVIPCFFVQNFVFYDIWITTFHMAFVLVGGFTTSTMFCLPANYCDVMHRAALHLGGWTRIDHRVASPATPWSKTTVWPNGSVVKYSGDFYRSHGLTTTAIPSNSYDNKFYMFFQNPAHIYTILSLIQVVIIVTQLFVLYFATEWHQMLSLGFLVLCNYFTLFKMIRDFFLTQRIYESESNIYARNLSN
ncbi:Transmembrane protein [Pseudolycoriella hygida]|uniref:Transmembrane protein n=1 Tax=Pseudolycoriella hygida TaxID=35572 RepID=A0A9Q0RU25_9DIPT|nr:Transmembrane protein [Pseudolycoriella hygida]